MRGLWTLVLLALLLASGAAAQAQPAVGEMQLPVRPTCVTSPFGNRPAPGPHALGFHNGIDLRAPAGGAVYAVAAGTIAFIHRRGPGGLEMAIVHHGSLGRYTSFYAHLGLIAPAFATGRTNVRAGERIAVIGRSGVTYGTHLFLALMIGGVSVDPAPFFPVAACMGR
jgi:murein DD-endopeptidase MepM/ murein hydrolase activator NlpD